jgi:xanthine dehydrogenase YagT iron-sulfur-binding subunit
VKEDRHPDEAQISQDENVDKGEVTRREFLCVIGAVTGGVALGVPTLGSSVELLQPPGAGLVPLQLRINGQQHNLQLDPRVTLLDLLRETLGLTGTKKGCDHGQCGACTVLANGRRINTCLSLAVSHDGDEITTVEGLAHGDQLHPLQRSFIKQDGLQCGYCTPGQLCSAVALLTEAQRGDASFVTADLAKSAPVVLSDDEIRERMSGNLCRCGAYPGIVAAVKAVSDFEFSANSKGVNAQ